MSRGRYHSEQGQRDQEETFEEAGSEIRLALEVLL